jgi:tetrahydromethanopterin S-methyltransferase subunit F
VTADRDELVPKHPRAETNAPLAVAPETSQAIEDPDARQAWREANRSLEQRVKRTEERLDDVASDTAEIKGMVVIIRDNSNESAKEREARRAKDAAALVARERRQKLDRRNKVIVTIVAGMLGLAGVLIKALA